MAETSKALFYNAENGDRVYDANSFEHLLKRFFTSGVFAGCCQVTADGGGMTCSMGEGYSNCDGKVRFFDESTDLLLQNAHATYDRIDTVVIERNDSDREITAKIVTGTYSAEPVPTAPVRSGGVYQLIVAEIYVAAGAVQITQANITDKRTDTDVCGYVMCAVQTPDFSELYAQFTAQAEEYIDNFEQTTDSWYAVQTSEFSAWFEEMKDQLSEDAAGHLQNEIDELEDGKIDREDIVDDLETDDAEKPLSAAMGKKLKDEKLDNSAIRLKEAIIDLVYPVGSIYQSTVNVSPATFMGGTWQSIRGKFLFAENDLRAAGDEGGEETVVLNLEHMPAHNHGSQLQESVLTMSPASLTRDGTSYKKFDSATGNIIVGNTQSSSYSSSQVKQISGTYTGADTATFKLQHTHQTQGSGNAHNNMPPYLSIYMWKRTA